MKRLLMVVLVVGAGCGKAKAGDSCSEPQCEDSKTAFFCENGIFRSIPCRGPQGCNVTSPGDTTFVECDESLAQPGDNCSADFVGAVECLNQPNALQCGGGEVWTAVQCPTMCVGGPPSVASCS
jgi:hypothetical protein